ncbi:MAG TPA: amidohydrolase family protein [Bryobacteraceae bacterium]|nr:amidohydrolase family protein [Bryobacteraceae bacterium]
MKEIVRLALLAALCAPAISAQVTALRVGHLVDPDAGTAAANQVILVESGKFSAVGANVSIPAGAETVDLSQYYISPGLVDAHNHLALTYKEEPEHNSYYLTSVLDSTAIRAIQAVSNGMTMMNAGFTMERDLGNNANYADTALRVAIEQGWIPGPTIINSGIIIGGFGGQFTPVPEREMLIYPEYLNADTNDEIVKAVRRNILYGAKVIKICVDCRPYGYTVDEMKLFVAEAAKAGLKVAGHVQTHPGAMRAIEAGIWSIEHSGALDDEAHRAMAQKGIWRVGTETPLTDYHTGNSPQAQNRYKRQEDGIRNAYSNHVKMAFSTDADYYIPGMTRGEVVIDFLKSWKDADIPAKEILKIMTINGYRVLDIYDKRGPIKPGLPADLIATRGNPLESIDTLRDVRYVMKDGVFFKKDGVMTPEKFFHSGPTPPNAWRIH